MLTITFDRSVGGLGGGVGGVGGGPYTRAEVDRLFGFSTPLGADYRGTWSDASTLSLELLDARGAGALVRGLARVFPSVAGDAVRLRNRAGCEGVPAARCLTPFTAPPPLLSGDFGVLLEPPRLLGFEVDDYDNSDDSFSVNDTLTIRFSGPTNKGGLTTDVVSQVVNGEEVLEGGLPLTYGGIEYIGALFNFSHVLGKAYDGEWLEDGSAFVISVHDVNFTQVRLDAAYADANGTIVQVDSPTAVSLKGSFRQPKGNSPALDASTSNVSAALSGSFGANATFPRVVSVVGRETVRHLEWELVLRLDRATDRGATTLPRPSCDPDGVLSWACLETLFSVLPSDAFSFAEDDDEGEPGVSAAGMTSGI